jgi:hypothetical protein
LREAFIYKLPPLGVGISHQKLNIGGIPVEEKDSSNSNVTKIQTVITCIRALEKVGVTAYLLPMYGMPNISNALALEGISSDELNQATV